MSLQTEIAAIKALRCAYPPGSNVRHDCASLNFNGDHLILVSKDEAQEMFMLADGRHLPVNEAAIAVETASVTDWRRRGPSYVEDNKKTTIFFVDRPSWRRAYRLARALRLRRGRIKVSLSEGVELPSMILALKHSIKIAARGVAI